MRLMPAGMKLPTLPSSKVWASLPAEERRELAKKMAVYAAMLDNADREIGRFRDYLKKAGKLDNTAFIVMSDNGADSYELSRLNLPFRLWYKLNYALGYDELGGKGSYVHYTQGWAEVSNTPFALFKGTAQEGGMRVPFIVSWPERIKGDRITAQFAYATDFLPTVLGIASIPPPGDEYKGKKLIRPTGTNLLPLLEGQTNAVHEAKEAIGFESTGGFAIFKGDYKLVRDAPPFGDNTWRLFNLTIDPNESRDLAPSEPVLLKDMLAEVETYIAKNGVVLPGPDYNGPRQVLKNNWPILLRQMWPILAAVLVVLLLLSYVLIRWISRSRVRGV